MHQGTTQIEADSLIFLIAPKAKESQRLSQLLKGADSIQTIAC